MCVRACLGGHVRVTRVRMCVCMLARMQVCMSWGVSVCECGRKCLYCVMYAYVFMCTIVRMRE